MADDIMNNHIYSKGFFSKIFTPCYLKSFLHSMRWLDYLNYHKRWYNIPLLIFHRIRYHRLSYKMGFEIPPSSIGYGVFIPHYGSITINPATKIGNYCVIHNNVTFADGDYKSIGNKCFFGTNVTVAHGIKIGNNCTISANSFVNQSFSDNKLLGGVIARTLRDNYPSWFDEGIGLQNFLIIEKLRKQMGLPEKIVK
ncbi:MAG: DapH/DapD/GlmU-related protein [Phocaeicola sp.]|nr:DapH/DapD/GlmU-related protein [Phocaeicola sp.]